MSRRCLLFVCAVWSASATTVTLTDPAPVFIATSPGPCFPENWIGCGATAYVSYGGNINQNTTFTNIGTFHPVDGTGPTGTESFLSGFNTFGGGWTLANGGDLPLNMNVSMFRAFASDFVAGVEIQVDVNQQPTYTGPPLNNLFWIQSLLINYRPSDPGNELHHLLDEAVYNAITVCTPLAGASVTGGEGTYCGPIYPYQYADKRFYDRPVGIYDIDSMRGIALLASVNANAKVVTVYNGGVSYGYDVFVSEAAVPEPSTWWLAAIAVVLPIARRVTR
jgi:hypothetical protein